MLEALEAEAQQDTQVMEGTELVYKGKMVEGLSQAQVAVVVAAAMVVWVNAVVQPEAV
jgi:hypothetical protein